MNNRILFPSTIATVLLLSNIVMLPAQANTKTGENGMSNDSGLLAPSFTPGETAASPAALTGVSGGSELFSGGVSGGGGSASSSAASGDGGGGGGSSSSAAAAGAASAGAASASAAATTSSTMAGLSSGSSGSVSLGG